MVKLTDYVERLYTADHGGECCGIVHVFTFPEDCDFRHAGIEPTLEEKIEYVWGGIKKAVESYEAYGREDFNPETWRCAVEVVLAEYQLEMWKDAVVGAGFREVYSFYNSNSGNHCHVFYHSTGG